MLGPTATTALLTGLEAVTQKALDYDPGTRARLQALAGQTLAVHITRPAQSVYLQFHEDGPVLVHHFEGEPTTALTGSALDLAKLLLTDTHSLHGTGVSLAGSTGLLLEVQTLIKTLDIDWEMALADHIGVLPARALAASLRQANRFKRGRAETALELGREYLSEEYPELVGRGEFETFASEVRELRLQLDRLEARADQLIPPGGEGKP